MIKRIKNLFFFLIFLFISNCSFDNKTGIWDGSEEEKKRNDGLMADVIISFRKLEGEVLRRR